MAREVVILAGGFGTRLKSVVNNVPKSMAPIAGRPFLEWQLKLLKKLKVTHVVFAVGYLSDSISHFFGSTYDDIVISYSLEQEPLGTGGAVKLALDKIQSECAFVLNGDSLSNYPFDAMQSLVTIHHAPAVVSTVKVLNAARYGAICFDKSNPLKVAGFSEKGVSGPGEINTGCYLLSKRSVLGSCPLAKFSLEQDYLEKISAQGDLYAVTSEPPFIDIGIPEDFHIAQELIPRMTE